MALPVFGAPFKCWLTPGQNANLSVYKPIQLIALDLKLLEPLLQEV